jgi:hypothetical protein
MSDKLTDLLIKSLGIPKHLLEGGMNYSSYSYALPLELDAYIEVLEAKLLAPLREDIENPLCFMHLLPLGKKLYARKYAYGCAPKIRITF